MPCKDFTNMPKIPFVASVEIPCGFVFNSTNVLDWDPKMFMDSHCLFVINEESKETAKLPNGAECEICVRNLVIAGALHYTIDIGNFVTSINGTDPTAIIENHLTHSQSICVHKLPVAYNCEDCPDICSKNISDYKFVPTFDEVTLYSNAQPTGIKWGVTAADHLLFINAITNDPANINGCKTLIFSGSIEVKKV